MYLLQAEEPSGDLLALEGGVLVCRQLSLLLLLACQPGGEVLYLRSGGDPMRVVAGNA